MTTCLAVGFIMMILMPVFGDFGFGLFPGFLAYATLVVVRHIIAWRRKEEGRDWIVYNTISVMFPWFGIWTIYLFEHFWGP
jgi:hypothetical protein